jgi:hypothetical protein
MQEAGDRREWNRACRGVRGRSPPASEAESLAQIGSSIETATPKDLLWVVQHAMQYAHMLLLLWSACW